MKFEKEFIKNNILIPVYKSLIDVENISEEEFEISLPLFLNTGDAVDIFLKKEDDKYILSNLLYRSLEKNLKENISCENLIKRYLFGENRSINLLKKEFIQNEIEDSLTNKKYFFADNEEAIAEEIFKYSFLIIRYYNFVYDYIIASLKTKEKSTLFFKEVENFVNNYNKTKKYRFAKIKNEELLSTSNEYYNYQEKILTGVNGKLHFLEAIQDIEILKQENKNLKKIVLVYDKFKKNNLSEHYIRKVFKIKNIKNSNYEINFLKE